MRPNWARFLLRSPGSPTASAMQRETRPLLLYGMGAKYDANGMMKIVVQIATFAIAFFVAQTLQFVGGWVLGLLFDKSTSYFSTISIISSFAFAAYLTFTIGKKVKQNTKLSATRVIKEGCNISVRILDAMIDNNIPGEEYRHLIQAATLEAIFGGSYLVPSGMNRDILQEGMRVYGEHFGDEFSRHLLDCHEAVQYAIKESVTPDEIIESSLVWLCEKLDTWCDSGLSEQQKNKLAIIFRCELSKAIKKSSSWISGTEE